MTPSTTTQPRGRRHLAAALALALTIWLVPATGVAAPGDFLVSQLTTNDVNEDGGSIDGDRVAWSAPGGSDGGTDYEIFTWKVGDASSTQVTVNASDDRRLCVSGDRLVWEGRGGTDGGTDREIFTWTPSGGTVQLTENPTDDIRPTTSGDRVVWRGTNQMFAWTPTEGVTPIPATSTNNADLFVSGDRIVWTGVGGTDGGLDAEIFTWRVGDATPTQVTQNNQGDAGPAISGDRLVWPAAGGTDGGTDWEIFTWKVGDATPRQLTTNDTHDDYPAVSGEYVVWPGAGGTDGGTDTEIFSWTVGEAAPTQITVDSLQDTNVQISGNRTVWEAGNLVFTWRVGDAAPTEVATGAGMRPYPRVSGDRIVWSATGGADGGTDYEIFTALSSSSQGNVSVRLQVAQTAPTLSFTITPSRAPQGGSVTAGSLDFGLLLAQTPKVGSHLLMVTTNAASGYTVTAEEDHPLSSGSNRIPDVTGDAGGVTEAVSGPWVATTTYGFGFTLANTKGEDAVFTTGYRQFADVSASERPEAVMLNARPVTDSEVEIAYKVNLGATQQAGTYTNSLTFLATGNF